jgi:Kef-type K+ transport system membrane component KefB
VTFAQLALICAVALLGPLLALPRQFRLPIVIGELIIGLVLGQSGFGALDSTNDTFSFLGQIGFALVMFVAGTHVPVRDPALRAGLRAGALRAAVIGLLATAVGVGLAAAFGTGHGLLYAVLLASSSAAIAMPALEGTPLTGRTMVALVPQVAVADAMCIVLLPLVIDPGNAPKAALGAVIVAIGATIFWSALHWAEQSGRRRAVHELSEDRGLAIELRSVLVALFIMAAVAQTLHVSTMLAGFATGLAVAAVGEPRRVANQVFALTEGFFAPVFFVWLGASLDLRELARHPSAIILGLSLGLAAVLVHAAGRLLGQPLPAAVLASAQLGVPVAAATIGSSHGLLGPGEPTAFLLGALVTILAVALVSSRVTALAQDEAATPAQPG